MNQENTEHTLGHITEPQPYEEHRPWGYFRQFVLNTPCTVKIIHVKADEALSLQYHSKRGEFWRVLSGKPRITIGDKTIEVAPGYECFVPTRESHTIQAGKEPVDLLEIALGEFAEDDIVRLQDRYGRI